MRGTDSHIRAGHDREVAVSGDRLQPEAESVLARLEQGLPEWFGEKIPTRGAGLSRFARVSILMCRGRGVEAPDSYLEVWRLIRLVTVWNQHQRTYSYYGKHGPPERAPVHVRAESLEVRALDTACYHARDHALVDTTFPSNVRGSRASLFPHGERTVALNS